MIRRDDYCVSPRCACHRRLATKSGNQCNARSRRGYAPYRDRLRQRRRTFAHGTRSTVEPTTRIAKTNKTDAAQQRHTWPLIVIAHASFLTGTT